MRARRTKTCPREGLRATRVFSPSPVESAIPALPSLGGGHVARGATLAGSAGSIVLSLSRVLFGVLYWRFGGNTGTPWFGMKPSSAHAGLDGIDRSHPPGGCNRRRSSKDIDFLLPPSADVPGATLTGNATVRLPRRAVVCRYGRARVQDEGRRARRASWARYAEQVSECVIVFVIILARAVTSKKHVLLNGSSCLCDTVNFTIKISCPASFLGAIGASWALSREIAGAQGCTVDVDRTRAAQILVSSFLFNSSQQPTSRG